MSFCSQSFLVFVVFVLAAYWSIASTRIRTILLVVASFWFYASWNVRLAAIVLGWSTLDFALGLALEATPRGRAKRGVLIGGIALNLGLLGYFKYTGFLIDSIAGALATIGLERTFATASVLAPIGISFFTFEAINYLVDVHQGKIRAERNVFSFLLFISFFPHLIAGPIVRAGDFLPQIGRYKRRDWSRIRLGCEIFLIGLFKKLAIADRMATFADPAFASPDRFGSQALWIAAIAYAVQIYCDFSGYTDMAIGCAHLFGFKLKPNFNAPYASLSIAEFWRRWHISLSTWLRDYLFIPLGGSRGSFFKTARNLTITMTLGGLWHGASWTFVVWGVVHGLLLVAHRGVRAFRSHFVAIDRAFASLPGIVLCWLLTTLTLVITWIPFRAASFSNAIDFLGGLFVPRAGRGVPLPVDRFAILLAIVLIEHAFRVRKPKRATVDRIPAAAVGFGYAALLSIALLLAPSETKAFIYFQF